MLNGPFCSAMDDLSWLLRQQIWQFAVRYLKNSTDNPLLQFVKLQHFVNTNRRFCWINPLGSFVPVHPVCIKSSITNQCRPTSRRVSDSRLWSISADCNPQLLAQILCNAQRLVSCFVLSRRDSYSSNQAHGHPNVHVYVGIYSTDQMLLCIFVPTLKFLTFRKIRTYRILTVEVCLLWNTLLLAAC